MVHSKPVLQVEALLLPKRRRIAILESQGTVVIMDGAKNRLETEGRLWMRGALSAEERQELIGLMAGPDRPGARIPLDAVTKRVLERCDFVQKIAKIWPGMRPVRAVGFQKHETANWTLPWHQDRVICVAERCDVDGYKNWSNKGGVWHCEPPLEVLQNMLFVRVHIDESTSQNGAMEIARGSHQPGLIPADQAEHVAVDYPNEITQAAPDDVLILPMLTLHRSGISQTQEGRRVLRIDFANRDLPKPLRWAG